MRCPFLIPLLSIALLLSAVSLGTAAVADESAANDAPETVSVRLGPLGASIKAKGLLEAVRQETLAAKPKVFSGPFKIAEVLKEGRVVEGQVLVRFEETAYEEQLAERERGMASSRNRLEKREQESALRKREAALAMDDTLRKKRLADEAMERFLEFERKAREEEARLSFRGMRNRIKDQQEELEQLEKMYSEDDLTEETEEIVLNRARRSLERSLKYHAFRKNRHDYTMKVVLPRQHEKLKFALLKASLALERLQATQPLDLAKAAMDLEKARRDFKKSTEKFEEFRADRSALTLKSPMVGHAVAGNLKSGKWSGLGSAASTLKVGNTVKAKQVLFTIVDDSTLRVRTSVKVADLMEVKEGGPASVTCALTGEAKFEAKVEHVARYGSGGSFAVTLRLLGKDKRLRSGVSCQVALPKASEEDVMSIPLSCVLKEKSKTSVFVVDDEGETVKTEVKLGEKADGRVEVKEGVKAGQKLLKNPPEEDETEDDDEDDKEQDDKEQDDDDKEDAKK